MSYILDIRISDGDSPLYLHFDHSDVSNEPLGFIVENRNLRAALLKVIKKHKRIKFIAPEQIVKTRYSSFHTEAMLQNNQKIKAKLIVAADGKNSLTRENAGISSIKLPYAQSAIICSVKHEFPHEFTAHEHFLPSGPFAILPLKTAQDKLGHVSSIVWTEKTKFADFVMSLPDKEFQAELTLRFGDFLGGLSSFGPRFSYPLSLQFAKTSIATRLALIGDASHSIHPIAGQGLNMGMRDISALTETLVDAQRIGLDIGNQNILTTYQRWRRFDNTLMAASTDSLNRLFSNNFLPIRLARGVGLATVNKMPWLRKVFMRHAMGISGDVPKLMREHN